MATSTLLDPDGIARLREALTAAAYTTDGLAARIGAAGQAGVRRNDFRAALRATAGGDPLDTLIRLYVCGQTEPRAAVERALSPLPLADALAAGLVEPGDGGLRAGVDLQPYERWWVLSDVSEVLRPGEPLRADHVLGIGGASTTLALATIREPVGTALDLGTGCGVQALHLATHAATVTATDVSERALAFAATNAALNGLDWELLAGDLVAPVAGRRFDLVVSNPPFVVGPGAATHTYRDSGRVGDAVCAELAAAADGLLTEGGYLQFLANWEHVAGEDWTDRVAGWLAGTSVDAWVVQREVADPVTYVQMWLRDAAESFDARRAAAWLDWFDERGVEAVGFGLVTLRRRTGGGPPRVRIEDLRQQPAAALGTEIPPWFGRQDWLRTHTAADLLGTRFTAAPDLRLYTESEPGSDGWEPVGHRLAMTAGLRWVEEVDEATAALVSGCDGTLPLADQLRVLAGAYGVTEAELTEVAVPVIGHLIERGFLTPCAP